MLQYKTMKFTSLDSLQKLFSELMQSSETFQVPKSINKWVGMASHLFIFLSMSD
jgi:hypothetical protein